MFLSLNKLQNIIPEFVDQRLMPSAPPMIKFVLGGAVPIVLSKVDKLVEQYKPLLDTMGVLDDKNRIDIDKASKFIRNGFDSSGTIPIYGFIIDKNDGEFLINLMEKYKDD